MKVSLSILLFCFGYICYAQQFPPVDSLRKIIETLESSDEERLSALMQLGSLHRSHPPTALPYFQEAHRIATRRKNPTLILKSAIELGSVHLYIGKHEQAAKLFQRAMNLPHDSSQKAHILLNLGLVKSAINDFDSATYYFQQAEILLKQLGRQQAQLYVAKGLAYGQRGEYSSALRMYVNGMSIAEEAQDSTLMAILSVNTAQVYLGMENYEKAIFYLEERALKHLKKDSVQNQMMIANTLNNLGEAYMRMGKLDTADIYLQQSLHIKRLMRSPKGIANALSYIGELHLMRKEYQKAWELEQSSLEMHQEMNDQQGVARARIQLAHISLKQQKYELARTQLDSAMQIAQSLGIKEELKELHQHYAKLDSIAGNYQQSLWHYQQYTALKDSMLNIQQAFNIADLEIELVIEKSEKETELLRRNDQLKEAQLATQHKLIVIGSFAAGVLLLLLIGLVIQYRDKQRTNSLLEIANAEIKRINVDLEDKVQARTQELERKNQQLIEYASMNSHKVRGPLARILGLINLLQVYVKSPQETETYIQKLELAANELDDVVKEINTNLTSQ